MEIFIALVGFALALAGVGMLAYLWVMLLAVIFPIPLALFIGVFTSSYAMIRLLMQEGHKK